MNHVSLAITHFNRYELLLECVSKVIDDPRIGEIVISDDASTDGSYDRLMHHFLDNPKVRLFRNTQNLDCYANKRQAVERATLDWVILFDSDNVLPVSYLDILYSLPKWEEDVAYCPDFAEPCFDYQHLVGNVFHRSNVAEWISVSSERASRLRKPNSLPYPRRSPPARTRFVPLNPRSRSVTSNRPSGLNTALNTCNYFIHRRGYLEVWDGSVDPHTADSIYQNFNWLKSGKKIVIVKGLRYFHRMHDDSHYKNNLHLTGGFAREVELKLKALR